jgi:hypothetical protein
MRGRLLLLSKQVEPKKNQFPTLYRDNIRLNVIGQRDFIREARVFSWIHVQVESARQCARAEQ